MKYTLLAEQIKAQFLAEFNMSLTDATNIVNRHKELNVPVSLQKSVEWYMTPRLDMDQEAIVNLVSELDSADAKRKAQIKYQLKNYYGFTLPK